MSSVVDVLCAEIQKSIERLNKSRLILIKCTQMLKEYDDKKFSVWQRVQRKTWNNWVSFRQCCLFIRKSNWIIFFVLKVKIKNIGRKDRSYRMDFARNRFEAAKRHYEKLDCVDSYIELLILINCCFSWQM